MVRVGMGDEHGVNFRDALADCLLLAPALELDAAAVGAVMASLVSLPSWFRDRRRLRQRRRALHGDQRGGSGRQGNRGPPP